MLDRLAASVQTLRLESNRLASLARADALEIGFLVARRILETEISTNPEALFSLVRSALRRVGESRDITIRLHPADASAVRQAEGTVLPQGPSISQIRLVGDPSLSPGDCVIDTEMGSFDGRLESRLAQLRRAASGAIGERS
ncbi:MAG TPA: FliH/SctL family protein [Vulgatibacter sp.]|nr:FliH/SctL family protein [Vulgatibacter sp.]